MSVLRTTNLHIDPNGRELVEYLEPSHPIVFYLDELHNYEGSHIRWHWHPQFELVLAKTETAVSVGNEQFHLSPGDGLWINAGQLHSFYAPEGLTDAAFYTILLTPEYIAARDTLIFQKYVSPLLESNAPACIPLRRKEPWQAGVLDAVTRATALQFSQSPGYELLVRNALCAAWTALCIHIPDSNSHPTRTSQHQQRLKTMLTFIQKNYMYRISLSDIAASAHISKSECLRCFKASLGTTPTRYLTEYRMEVACQLLRSTEHSIREIAQSCGYEDPGYFGRLFRMEIGVTPLQYRRQHGLS